MVLLSHTPAFSREPPVHGGVARPVLPGGHLVRADLERRCRFFASSPRPAWYSLADGASHPLSGLAARCFLDQNHNTIYRSPRPSSTYLSPQPQAEAIPSVSRGVAVTRQYPLDHDP